MTNNKTLIIQGGGLRTAFSNGVLDAFIASDSYIFNRFIAVSSGAMAMSFFLSKQYRFGLKALQCLTDNNDFLSVSRLWKEKAYMNIDYLRNIATEIYLFDIENAHKNGLGNVEFVATDTESGYPVYLKPVVKDWIGSVIASSTLPFVTKGTHAIKGKNLMDGGWSDPLPIEHAYNTGARDILIVRTTPVKLMLKQSMSDYFGSIYHAKNPALSACFANTHIKYNQSIDFINNPPSDLKITQISPEMPLKSGTFSFTTETLNADYRYGMECGLNFIHAYNNQ